MVFGFVGVMGLLGAILSFGILVQAGHQLLGQAFDQSAPSFVAHATVQLKTILEAWIPAECRLELDEIYNRSLWRSEPVGDILGSLVNVCVKGSITQTSPGELI